jgi:hypothetical protein
MKSEGAHQSSIHLRSEATVDRSVKRMPPPVKHRSGISQAWQRLLTPVNGKKMKLSEFGCSSWVGTPNCGSVRGTTERARPGSFAKDPAGSRRIGAKKIIKHGERDHLRRAAGGASGQIQVN